MKNTAKLTLLLPLASLLILPPSASQTPPVGGPISEPKIVYECGETDLIQSRETKIVLCEQWDGLDIGEAFSAVESWWEQRIHCPSCVDPTPGQFPGCQPFVQTTSILMAEALGNDCWEVTLVAGSWSMGCTECIQ